MKETTYIVINDLFSANYSDNKNSLNVIFVKIGFIEISC